MAFGKDQLSSSLIDVSILSGRYDLHGNEHCFLRHLEVFPICTSQGLELYLRRCCCSPVCTVEWTDALLNCRSEEGPETQVMGPRQTAQVFPEAIVWPVLAYAVMLRAVLKF